MDGFRHEFRLDGRLLKLILSTDGIMEGGASGQALVRRAPHRRVCTGNRSDGLRSHGNRLDGRLDAPEIV